MEDIKIFENYFKKKYKVICEIIEYFYINHMTMALWGAGVRGRAFLNVFDAENKMILNVFDKDKGKYGKTLETGHKIVDYLNHDADIVFVSNNSLEYNVFRMFRNEGKNVRVLNIDSIILGDLNKEDIISIGKRDLTQVRNTKIAALVIAYYPDDSVVNNIKSYAKDLDIVYVHDNSEIKNKKFADEIRKIDNVKYFFSGKNQGLALPINKFYRMAIEQRMDWFITFDQDSTAKDNMVSLMRTFVNSSECDEKVGIVSPTINELDNKYITNESFLTYYNWVIQSGAMHRLSMMKKVGDYNEELFIDQVDLEYCVRCRAYGYYVVRFNQAMLLHNQSDNNVKKLFMNGSTVFIDKYSPARYYYRYRNALYCYHKYHEIDSIYGILCLNTLKRIERDLGYDTCSDMKKEAVNKAKEDFRNKKMGKLKE